MLLRSLTLSMSILYFILTIISHIRIIHQFISQTYLSGDIQLHVLKLSGVSSHEHCLLYYIQYITRITEHLFLQDRDRKRHFKYPKMWIVISYQLLFLLLVHCNDKIFLYQFAVVVILRFFDHNNVIQEFINGNKAKHIIFLKYFFF